MEQAVESVLVKFEQDDRSQEIDRLLQANANLEKEILSLKATY